MISPPVLLISEVFFQELFGICAIEVTTARVCSHGVVAVGEEDYLVFDVLRVQCLVEIYAVEVVYEQIIRLAEARHGGNGVSLFCEGERGNAVDDLIELLLRIGIVRAREPHIV